MLGLEFEARYRCGMDVNCGSGTAFIATPDNADTDNPRQSDPRSKQGQDLRGWPSPHRALTLFREPRVRERREIRFMGSKGSAMPTERRGR